MNNSYTWRDLMGALRVCRWYSWEQIGIDPDYLILTIDAGLDRIERADELAHDNLIRVWRKCVDELHNETQGMRNMAQIYG